MSALSILAEIAEDTLAYEVEKIVQNMADGYPGGYVVIDDVLIVAEDIEALAGFSPEQITRAATNVVDAFGIPTV
jgi:hypothetical protein